MQQRALAWSFYSPWEFVLLSHLRGASSCFGLLAPQTPGPATECRTSHGLRESARAAGGWLGSWDLDAFDEGEVTDSLPTVGWGLCLRK